MEFSLSYASHYIIATLHVATPKKIATEDTDGASRDTPLIVGRNSHALSSCGELGPTYRLQCHVAAEFRLCTIKGTSFRLISVSRIPLLFAFAF